MNELDDFLSDSVTGATICGIDEVGRGSFAGPLVAAAVVFPTEFVFTETFPKIKFGDSKKLSAKQREAAFSHIHEFALSVKLEVVDVADINQMGVGWANRAALERLIMQTDADRYIVDGKLKLANLGKKSKFVTCMVDADDKEGCVSAASIIAKVTRDRIMTQLHADYPVYNWARNAGYGTREHIAALREHGRTEHHRDRFIATALAKKSAKLPGLGE